MRILPVTHREAARAKNIFLSFFQKESVTQETLFSYFSHQHQEAVKKLSREEFRAEFGETKSVWFSEGPVKRILLFGWGEKSKWNERKASLVARRYVQYAKGEKITEFSAPLGLSASIFATNALAANFEFVKYKEKPQEGWPEVKTIYLAADEKDHSEIRKGIRQGMIIGEEMNLCRELTNTPGGDMTPAKLAEAAVLIARRTEIKVKVLEEKAMQRLGMGGILGVARGSDEKPQFIIMEYFCAPKGQKPLVLVGKGVTFDTGGLNLKSEQSINEMHLDMSGGAAVIHGVAALARLGLPIHVVGLVPAVENMPSGSSYHPGDILKTMSGKTIEVLNTDAEGRIILADALHYGAVKYKPGFMLDIATLTGAAHVALGNYCSAIFTNREELMYKLVDLGKRSGDYVWPLPLWDEYLSEIKGTFGDIANMGKGERFGGAIHGAKFLEQFVGKIPWAHIDMAPRMTAVESEYLSKGASGTGVRYLVELAKEYPNLIS